MTRIQVRENSVESGRPQTYNIEIQERGLGEHILNPEEQNELVHNMIDRYRALGLNDIQITHRMNSFSVLGKNSSIEGETRYRCITAPICGPNNFRLVPAREGAALQRPIRSQVISNPNTAVSRAVQAATVHGVVQRRAFQGIYNVILREYDRRVRTGEIPNQVSSNASVENYYVVSAADRDFLTSLNFGNAENRNAFVEGLLASIRSHVLGQIREGIRDGGQVDAVISHHTPGASFIEHPSSSGTRMNYYQIVDGAFYNLNSEEGPELVPYRIINDQIRNEAHR